jgi:hypothetical protein
MSETYFEKQKKLEELKRASREKPRIQPPDTIEGLRAEVRRVMREGDEIAKA